MLRHRLLDDLERLLTRGMREDAQRAGVSEAGARVLLALEPQEAVSMGEVAARMGRDPSTATRFVDRAVAAGWVLRATGRDRRCRLAVLTPRGGATRARLVRLRNDRARTLPPAMVARTGLGADEVAWFLEALVPCMGPRRP
ncbi:MAG: MarR family winged helix-turn-helix transcriptional regulator [Planctomycetota bacterium]